MAQGGAAVAGCNKRVAVWPIFFNNSGKDLFRSKRSSKLSFFLSIQFPLVSFFLLFSCLNTYSFGSLVSLSYPRYL